MKWSLLFWTALTSSVSADDAPPIVDVEGQPLAANVTRLIEAMAHLGAPFPKDVAKNLTEAGDARDAGRLQRLLDPHVLLVVTLNPEARVKVSRGPASANLQQAGFTPVLIKVINDSTVTKRLQIISPQAGRVYGGPGQDKRDPNDDPKPGRFLQAEVFTAPPMTANLSGLRVEYDIALLYSTEAGKREAVIGFDVGQGNQDLGFRGEVPMLFDIRPAVPVKLAVIDFDSKPTVGRFTFRDRLGRIYPSQAKRLAPDFFFQQQIYRADGDIVLLPPGELIMTYGRGPEYRLVEKKITVPERGDSTVSVKLERWINPADHGYFSGDHHIHAAGCAHYTSPTEGVFAHDMFLHVKGEGLNVGCNLTWGPCFEFQRQFFEPTINKLSEPFTVLKYDIEVSGFGSQALGHVCLLNLRDQNYPGSDGTKTKGWPTWTTPVMRWAKEQGGVTGYAHSAIGLSVDVASSSRRLFTALDRDKNGSVTPAEASNGLLPLPESFETMDSDQDGALTQNEIVASTSRTRNNLPNFCVPELDGIGAQEICVTTAQGLCDFISAMDTARVPEWNCWYHIMNCGFPLKASGETDFPCISGSRVGQGRVYVRLGNVDRVDFAAWCRGLAEGKSYISDGYAHALDFRVIDVMAGPDPLKLDQPRKVKVTAKLAFAREVPLGTSIGAETPRGPTRKIELIVNGNVAATQTVDADDRPHDVSFEVQIEGSSWVALRQYPQLHTNPVIVLVGGQPIRASRRSALWCAATIEQLWRVRGQGIAKAERDEAERTFKKAIGQYRKIAAEAPPGS